MSRPVVDERTLVAGKEDIFGGQRSNSEFRSPTQSLACAAFARGNQENREPFLCKADDAVSPN